MFHRGVSGAREGRHIRLTPGLLEKLLKRESSLCLGSESVRHRGDKLPEHRVNRDTVGVLEELEHCGNGPQGERLGLQKPPDTGLQFSDVVDGKGDMSRGHYWLFQQAREALTKLESLVVVRQVPKPISVPPPPSVAKQRTFSSSRQRPLGTSRGLASTKNVIFILK